MYRNTFLQNSGFTEANVLYIRKRSTELFNPLLTGTSHFCGGIYLDDNSFTANAGCLNTKHALRFYCMRDDLPTDSAGLVVYKSALDTQNRGSQEFSSNEATAMLDLSVTSFPLVTETIAYDEKEIQVDSRRLELRSVTLDNNYAGHEGTAIHIEGFAHVVMNTVVFTDNGNAIPDTFAAYSPIFENVQQNKLITGVFKL